MLGRDEIESFIATKHNQPDPLNMAEASKEAGQIWEMRMIR